MKTINYNPFIIRYQLCTTTSVYNLKSDLLHTPAIVCIHVHLNLLEHTSNQRNQFPLDGSTSIKGIL